MKSSLQKYYYGRQFSNALQYKRDKNAKKKLCKHNIYYYFLLKAGVSPVLVYL